MQREKLRVRAGKRAWSFERRTEKGRGSELARCCWEEMRRDGKGWFGEILYNDREKQNEERIRSSNYNRWYREIKELDRSEYLKKGWGESRWWRVMI